MTVVVGVVGGSKGCIAEVNGVDLGAGIGLGRGLGGVVRV